MENRIFFAINNLAGQNDVFDKIGIFFGVYLIYFLIAFVLLLVWNKKYWLNICIAVITAIFARVAIVEVIKHLVNRPRPYEVLDINLLVTDTDTGLAFSSGHAVILFGIAFAFYKTRFFYPFLILAALGSVGRIFIGVHYPLDVLTSILIAFVVAVLVRAWVEHNPRLFKNSFLR